MHAAPSAIKISATQTRRLRRIEAEPWSSNGMPCAARNRNQGQIFSSLPSMSHRSCWIPIMGRVRGGQRTMRTERLFNELKACSAQMIPSTT